MISSLDFWQVDAFTPDPFKGNPAAVLVLYQELSDELTFKMSSITTFSQFFSFILGYNYSNSKSESSIGFSFKYRKIQFDYGVAFHTALGNPIIFSLKYNI